jgi:hypothetical protein
MTGVMRKIPIHSVIFIALIVPQAALAQAVITEIMYDPPGTDSGHEWIEVYNASASPIPLATWKIYEGDASHKIVAASGDKMLAAQTYAVIAESVAKFSADHPDFTGELFHSAFSLDNAGETIELHDASSTTVESAAYDSSQGALGDGSSLQRLPDDAAPFSPHTPSPGAAMPQGTIAPKVKTPAPPKSKSSASKRTTAAKSPASASASGARSSASAIASNDAGNMAVVAPQSVAAAVSSNQDDSYWWLAALALILLAAGAIFTSKHFKSREWDIVEEKPEDV